MIPVATPTAMAAYDEDNRDRMAQLIAEAAWHVARNAIEMMGGSYGRRVVVVAGPGNNGADGNKAAEILSRRGVGVCVVGPGAPLRGPRPDLVIDAAFGVGLSRSYEPTPIDPGIEVLAVDVPSGLDALTGTLCDGAWRATRTVTFVATKPGLYLGHGPQYGGEIVVADLSVPYVAAPEPRASIGLVTQADAARLWPRRARTSHKWNHAVWVIAGTKTMTGAARLAALGAQRGGASYVRVSVPGVDEPPVPTEAVVVPLGPEEWGPTLERELQRVASVVIGPGLGRSAATVTAAKETIACLARRHVPTVIDADGLAAVSITASSSRNEVLTPTCVLTPHDGEYRQLTGHVVGDDRLGAAQDLAEAMNATVLLKGPTTVVAAPDGRTRLITSGDARLATAGSGDVLSGLIAAVLSYGVEPLEAASIAAWVHGRAATVGALVGMTASDVAAQVPAVASALVRIGETNASGRAPRE